MELDSANKKICKNHSNLGCFPLKFVCLHFIDILLILEFLLANEMCLTQNKAGNAPYELFIEFTAHVREQFILCTISENVATKKIN